MTYREKLSAFCDDKFTAAYEWTHDRLTKLIGRTFGWKGAYKNAHTTIVVVAQVAIFLATIGVIIGFSKAMKALPHLF